MPARRPRLVAAAVGILLSGLVTLIMLAPALGPGFLLYRDFVTVPDPVLGARTWGFAGPAPRAVPLDGVMALLAPMVPTWLQQKVILLGAMWLFGSGVAVLLRHRGVVVAGLAGVVGTWSPFAAERLLLGQAPTLLAWSALPWLVAASLVTGSTRRRVLLLLVASLPAMLTPTGGVTAAAAAVTLSLVLRRRARETWALAGLGLVWCLPWLVPALGGRTGAGVTAGADAFRVEVNGVAGIIDVLTGGGVWAAGARLASRGDGVTVAAMVLLLVLAGVGLTQFPRRRRRFLLLGLLAPPLVALLLATPPGLAAFGAAQSVPGVALFRDTHRLLALSSFVLAVLVPVGMATVGRRVAQGPRRGAGGLHAVAAPSAAFAGRSLAGVALVGTAMAGVALAVLAAPDAPARLHLAYEPVFFPDGWREVIAAVGEEHALVMPWQPMRQAAWNDDRPFLDPLPLALRGETVAANDLVVRRDGETFVVRSADPPESSLWRQGRVDVAVLHSLGITRVVEWRHTPGGGMDPAGLRLLSDSPQFRVWVVE